MKSILKQVILLVAFLAVISLGAQTTNFSVFKVTVYQQTNGTIPTAPDYPNAYFFGAQYGTADSSDYIDEYFTDPANLEVPIYLNENATNYFNFGSPYYADKTSFDTDYPNGEYDFFVDRTNFGAGTVFTDTGSVIIPDQDFYATNVAGFTTNCWIAMQHADPSQDFTLNWNSFVPSSVTTSAFTFVDIYDQNAGTEPYNADFLDPSTMTTNIPANTLQYGKTYRINNIFSSRQDTPDAGFGGALGTVGFDNQTYTTLITISPWLHIAGAGTEVVLTWPALASNYVLEIVGQLSPSSVWVMTTNVPVTMGSTNFVTLPAAGTGQFFRLYPVSSE
jgi:hypothetical protein